MYFVCKGTRRGREGTVKRSMDGALLCIIGPSRFWLKIPKIVNGCSTFGFSSHGKWPEMEVKSILKY